MYIREISLDLLHGLHSGGVRLFERAGLGDQASAKDCTLIATCRTSKDALFAPYRLMQSVSSAAARCIGKHKPLAATLVCIRRTDEELITIQVVNGVFFRVGVSDE